MFSNGGHKAITLSFDDGITQDIRLIALLNRYGLKATFNLNSGRFGKKESLVCYDKEVRHDFVSESEVKAIYSGHEVAVRTSTHPDLTKCDDETVVKEVKEDEDNLTALVGYPVIGMAYPYGAYDERVLSLIRSKTGVKYSRGVNDEDSFLRQKDLLAFRPNAKISDFDRAASLYSLFLSDNRSEDLILYLWCHSYEFDAIEGGWDKLESLLKLISSHKNIYFGTNKEVLIDSCH